MHRECEHRDRSDPDGLDRGAPTLLIFTLGAEGESRRRAWLPPAQREVEVALRRGCFEAAANAGREAGCRLEIASPAPLPAGRWRPQQGRTFGERLGAALAALEAESRGPHVVVGTDVPGLEARHVRAALDALAGDDRRAVLGPSPDGGFYLLAAARPVAHLLREAPWCRRDTFARLRRILLRAGFEVVLLEPLADLDRRADLERWLAAAAAAFRASSDRLWRGLIGRLRRLLARLARPLVDVAPCRLRLQALPLTSGRSPPRPRR